MTWLPRFCSNIDIILFRFTAEKDLSSVCSNCFYVSLFYDNNIYCPFALEASIEKCSGFVINNQLNILSKKFPGRFDCIFLSFVRFIRLLINIEFYIFFQYVLFILDCFISICNLWDKFLNLIISYILIFYRNFELIPYPYVAETFAFPFTFLIRCATKFPLFVNRWLQQ